MGFVAVIVAVVVVVVMEQRFISTLNVNPSGGILRYPRLSIG